MMLNNPTDPDFIYEDIVLDFEIYSVDDYTKVRDRVTQYRISFASKEFLRNLEKKVSRSFSGKSISQIVKTIYTEELEGDREISILPTTGLHDFVIPNWSPFHTINWLASRAISEDENGANYFFFGNLGDVFRFTSLENLFREEEVETYTYQITNVAKPTTPDGYYDENDYKIVKDYQVDTTTDIINNISVGMYSNKLITHDIVKRKYEVLEWDYSDTFSKYQHIDKGRLVHENFPERYKEIYDSHRMLIPTHYQMFGSQKIPSRDSSGHENTLQVRTSQLQQINNFTITIPGDFKRRSGDIIYFFYPLSGIQGGEIKEDKHYSGRYLVYSVRHIITTTEHETLLELVKDTYFSSLPDIKPGGFSTFY